MDAPRRQTHDTYQNQHQYQQPLPVLKNEANCSSYREASSGRVSERFGERQESDLIKASQMLEESLRQARQEENDRYMRH